MNFKYLGEETAYTMNFSDEILIKSLKEHLPEVLEAENEIGKALGVSLEMPGKVTFAPKREFISNREKRLRTTLGKYINRHLKISCDELKDRIEKVIAESCETVMVVEGEKILSAYYSSHGNTSCMTGPDNQEYLDLFLVNPETIKCVLYKSGTTEGRALLWKHDEGWFMDRVYCNGDFPRIKRAMEDKVREMGDLIERKNNETDAESCQKELSFSINTPEEGGYPFMDTFMYGYYYEGTTYLTNDQDSAEFILDSTCGEVSEC